MVSHEVIIQLIANTRTRTGLRIRAALDAKRYELGEKVSKAAFAGLRVKQASFHGDWDYTILPRHN